MSRATQTSAKAQLRYFTKIEVLPCPEGGEVFLGYQIKTLLHQLWAVLGETLLSIYKLLLDEQTFAQALYTRIIRQIEASIKAGDLKSI